nr:uncharacterized protein LOC111504707 [Leptinotarsa decemlineata]
MDSASSKCSVCDTEFTEKKNLYRHLRKFHQIEPLEYISKPVPKFECSVCAKHFSYLSSLLRHIRQNHLTDDEGDYLNIGAVRKIRILCPHKICNEEFMNYKKLREHLLEQHDVHVEYEELTFNSIAGFEEWKDEIQHSTMSLYTQDSAGYQLKNGSNRIFYNCHRSYSAKSKAKHIGAKSIVSNKIDKACPSRLEVTTTEIDGETLITVKYWKTHHGHDEQIGRITKKKKKSSNLNMDTMNKLK